jgi:hypothetical protein
MRDGAITNAEITFTAPYAVTSASEFYSVTAKTSCGLFQAGPHVDVPAGGTVSVPIERLLTATNSRSLSIQATHTRFAAGTLQTADVGSIAVHLPPGTHALSPLIPVLGRQATRCRRPR